MGNKIRWGDYAPLINRLKASSYKLQRLGYDSCDIEQEAKLRIMEATEKFRERNPGASYSHERNYVARSTINRIRDLYRRDERNPDCQEFLEDVHDCRGDEPDIAGFVDRVRAAEILIERAELWVGKNDMALLRRMHVLEESVQDMPEASLLVSVEKTERGWYCGGLEVHELAWNIRFGRRNLRIGPEFFGLTAEEVAELPVGAVLEKRVCRHSTVMKRAMNARREIREFLAPAAASLDVFDIPVAV